MAAEEFLRTVPLFSGLEKAQLASIAGLMNEYSFAPGESIVTEGGTAYGLYVIAEGAVEVIRRDSDGDRNLRRMGPGEHFGELALLTKQRRTATVRALDRTVCYLLTSMRFDKLMDTQPALTKALCKTLAGWLASSNASELG